MHLHFFAIHVQLSFMHRVLGHDVLIANIVTQGTFLLFFFVFHVQLGKVFCYTVLRYDVPIPNIVIQIVPFGCAFLRFPCVTGGKSFAIVSFAGTSPLSVYA